MLTGCIDQSNDNSSVLKNALIAIFQVGIAAIVDAPTGAGVGINQISIPGFENEVGSTPTDVTIVASTVPSDYQIFGSNGNTLTAGVPSTGYSFTDFDEFGVDSLFAVMGCNTSGKTTNITISYSSWKKLFCNHYIYSSVGNI